MSSGALKKSDMGPGSKVVSVRTFVAFQVMHARYTLWEHIRKQHGKDVNLRFLIVRSQTFNEYLLNYLF